MEHLRLDKSTSSGLKDCYEMKRSQVLIVFGLLNLRERTGVSLVGQRIYTPLELFVRTNSDNFSRSFRRQAFGKWLNDLVENCRIHVLIISQKGSKEKKGRRGTQHVFGWVVANGFWISYFDGLYLS